MNRRRWHRGLFLAAGVYNLAWGAVTGLDPQWYFRAVAMPPINHPEIMACLGMVVGIYGLCYLEVARAPERGFAIAAVGLLGKVLGPAGAFVLVARGTWPARFLWQLAANDFLWWIPFALYLRDAWPLYRAGFGPAGASGEKRDG